ncbi:hypothetical protein [Nevskia soli]|uniref:hypothetical protein n=1 Tax=Nevskia soli TaxID=418856 RepID=UPI0012FC6BF8|nr:hypothetical protein [Nevskia soli]
MNKMMIAMASAATVFAFFTAAAEPPHGHAGPAMGHVAPARHDRGGVHNNHRDHHVPPPPYLGDHWQEGHWRHGDHGHRGGWWWVTGGNWFWYEKPIYPYPDFYVPPAIIVETPPGPPPAQYWYYCERPEGYYPYVTQCDVPWKPVTATPPPAPLPPGN